MSTSVYPGSFDPITNGHLDVIKRGTKVFDKVIVTVGDNPAKKALFTKDERVEMIREVTKAFKNVEVDGFDGEHRGVAVAGVADHVAVRVVDAGVAVAGAGGAVGQAGGGLGGPPPGGAF